MITKIAKCTVKSDCLIAFNEITDNMINETRKEVGSISYELYRDTKNENVFYFIENWKDKEAFKSHLKEEHLIEAVPKLNETLSKEMELTSLELEK